MSANETLLTGEENVFEVSGECGENETLDPVSLRCRGCSVCGAHSHRRRACEWRRDTECECNRDYYYDEADVESDGLCRPCDLCPHGWGAQQPCTPHRNSVCARCAPGTTYSSLLSTTLACFPCTTCNRHQILYHNCTTLHDTVCIEVDVRQVKTKHHLQVVSPGSAPHQLDHVGSSAQDYHSVWPIYSALLLTLLLATLAYFVLKRWKLSSAHHSRRRLTTTTRPSHDAISPSSSSSASTGCVDELYRDVCRSKRRLLENMLIEDGTGRNNWKHLALYLGYSVERVMELELRGSGSGAVCSGSRRLLNDWASQHSSLATTQTLTAALEAIHRHDIVVLLLLQHHTPRCLCPDTTKCNHHLQHHMDNCTLHRVINII